MATWRERTFREIRDELNRFLNYPSNQAIRLGDFGYYYSRFCDFEWVGNLEDDSGITVPRFGRQGEMFESYATSGAVKVEFRANAGNQHVAGISFSRTHAQAVRAFHLGLDRVNLLTLARQMGTAIESGELTWDVKRVIVTSVSKADGFTQLVSGKSGAAIDISATATGLTGPFNFADVTLGLSVQNSSAMAYETVAEPNATPFFTLHKLRRSPLGTWTLYRYGKERFGNEGIDVI